MVGEHYERLASAFTHVDELVYRYLLEGMTFYLGAGPIHCCRVFRSPYSRRLLAICDLPSGRRLSMPAQELLAAVTMQRGMTPNGLGA